MPLYDYKCKECEKVKEYYMTMTEHFENPPEKCEKCEGVIYQLYDAQSPMKFTITGEGAYYPNKLQ